MDKNIDKRHILFGINSIAHLLVFIAICVSIGFSHSTLNFINGVFFIIYFFSLWNTVTDTFEIYDRKYFIVDMLSIAIYANVPRLFFIDMPPEQFFVCFWSLFALNEAICIGWDLISHFKAKNEKAKNFHMIWTLLTFIGIVFIGFSIMLICQDVFKDKLLIFSIINITYQLILLLAWWISQYRIEQKNLKQS